MMKFLRFRLACVLLCFVALGARGQPPEPIPAGPLTARFIGYEFAVYYPGLPAKAPMDALQNLLRTAANPPRLVTAIPEMPPATLLHARFVSDVQATY